MQKSELYAGQIVRLSGPKAGTCTVKVTKVNPKNVKVVKQDGAAWNVHPSFLSLATQEQIDAFKDAFEAGKESPTTRLGLGVAVRFRDINMRKKYPVLIVVGEHSGALRLAPLGGDNGRYYRGILPEQVEVVNLNMSGV